MANKCKVCNGVRSQQQIDRMRPYCESVDCMIAWSMQSKQQANGKKIIDKAWRADTAEMREKARKRAGKEGHYEPLKLALHQYVKHVLRRGEPCYTCDLQQKFQDKPQNFHVGHFMPADSIDPRRFMLENLRIQCQRCNSYNSGRQSVYKDRMIAEMGAEHVEWLERESNHEELKVKYPDVEDIKKEAARYRRLYREGVERIETEQALI